MTRSDELIDRLRNKQPWCELCLEAADLIEALTRSDEAHSLTPDEILAAAWSTCAPNRAPGPFPRGFWPDVARVAVFKTLNLPLDFRPTMCQLGNYPMAQPTRSKAKTRAENTARLLAELTGQPTQGA